MVFRLALVSAWLVSAGLLPNPAHADQSAYENGEALLRQVAAKYKSVRALEGDVEEVWQSQGQTGTRRAHVRLCKPNLARLDYSVPDRLTVWDGKRVWWLDRSENTYAKSYSDSTIVGPVASDESPVAFFFSTWRLTFKPVAEYIGTETISGELCQIVDASLSQGRERLAIGPDLLIRRITGTHNKVTFTNSLANITCDGHFPEDAFSFQLPTGAKRRDKPSAAVFAPPGSSVQGFSIKTFDGKIFRLADALKRNKLVLVHFWSYP